MGSLGELSIGDVTKALGRYKPVVVSVLAILLALAVLPRPGTPAGLASTSRSGADIATPAARGSASPPAGGAEVAAVDGTSVDATTIPFSPSVSSGATSFPSFSSGASAPSSSGSSPAASDGGGSGGSEPSTGVSGPITSGTSSVDTTNGPPPPKPLAVVATAYASRTAGTPLAKDGVPAGTLPIGTRATQDDKRSFVRLSGDGTALGFAEDPAGARATSGPVKVQACKATAAFKGGEGIDFRDAPAYDAARCVQGERSASGVWIFDLSSFPDRTDDFGFALVPGAGAGIDFQVAFRP